MKTSTNGLKFISKEEGNILKAYQDSVGVWTIGVGHTSVAGEPKVYKGLTITADQSQEILARDIVNVEKQVLSYVKVPLTQNQFDALVSLCFNIGPGNFGNSTLVKKLNTKDYKGAAEQFSVWNKGTINGKKTVMNGLVNRRAREKALFLSDGEVITIKEPQKPVETISVTPSTETPPTKNTFLAILAELFLRIFK